MPAAVKSNLVQTRYVPHTTHTTFLTILAPPQEAFNETRVKITGLNAVTTYRFQIFAENGVSHMSSKPAEYADIQVTTEAAVPSSITNVRVLSVKSSEMVLAWDAPSTYEMDIENEIVDTYEVSIIYSDCQKVLTFYAGYTTLYRTEILIN